MSPIPSQYNISGRLYRIILAYYEGQCSKTELFCQFLVIIDSRGPFADIDDIIFELATSTDCGKDDFKIMDEFIGWMCSLPLDKPIEIFWSSGFKDTLPHATEAVKNWINSRNLIHYNNTGFVWINGLYVVPGPPYYII